MEKRSYREYLPFYIFAAFLFFVAVFMGDIRTIPQGLIDIVLANDILITDYVGLVGIAPAFTNAALVTLFTAELLRFNGIPLKGKAIYTMSLMSGFAFFGKNIFNMWPILFGTYVYTKVRGLKFGTALIVGLLSTAIGPIVSTTFFYTGELNFNWAAIGLGCGFVIGFVMPILAEHTSVLLHGMSLYNLGFSVGLLGLVIVSVLKSYGVKFITETVWATEYNFSLGLMVYIMSGVLIVLGLFVDKKNAFKNFLNILKRPGLPKDDFCELDGYGAVLINMGVNGMVATTYILLIGGDINGATIGGIFTVMGFGAQGKHVKNIVPIMIGVALGGLTKTWSISAPASQFAALFGTTLAPISGTYGMVAGVVAGFIHSSVVLNAGLGYSGANLYNNGYAGGIVSIVMYAVLRTFCKHPNTYSEPSPSMAEPKSDIPELFEEDKF